jgi:tetratricopeptide (TPR) repeat protein
MKRKDLYTHFQSLEAVKDLKGVKFAYSVLKNKKKIEEEIKLFEEVIKPNPEYEEYERKRIVLCEVHSEKDTEGRPIVVADKYKLVDYEAFNEELEKLKLGYKEIISERIEQINEYNKVLEETISLDFLKINFVDIPSDITPSQLESIDFMVNME